MKQFALCTLMSLLAILACHLLMHPLWKDRRRFVRPHPHAQLQHAGALNATPSDAPTNCSTPQDVWVTPHWAGRTGNNLWQAASSFGIAHARCQRWCLQNLKYSLLDDAVLFTVAAPECPPDIHFEDDLEGPSHNYKFVPSLMSAQGKGHSRVGEYLQSVKYFRNSGIPFVLRHREWAEGWIQAQGINTAIHVRRAEYAGGVRAPASYYDKALQTLARRAPGELLRFIILTDDPDWVRQQPVFQGMPVAQGNSPAHDLALIAACKHIILSLGTFGLWGAYMKKSQEVGFVIYWLVSFQISHPDFEAEGTWLPHWIPIAAS